MKTTRIRWLALVLLALPLIASAAGTVTVTTIATGRAQNPRHSIAWVSTAGGAVSGNALGISPGWIIGVQFVPDGGGTAPTTLYDVVLNDARGVDILLGGGADLSATLSHYVRLYPEFYHDGVAELDAVVSNAGNAKGGTILLWVRP